MKKSWRNGAIIVAASAAIAIKLFAGDIFSSGNGGSIKPINKSENNVIEVIVEKELASKLKDGFADDLAAWFTDNVYYGPEILTFDKVYISSEVDDDPDTVTYGYYDPVSKAIVLQPEEVIDFMGGVPSSVDDNPYSSVFWEYTLSHEYGHHMSVSYGSTSEFLETASGNSDIELNHFGQAFFEALDFGDKNITDYNEFTDEDAVGSIRSNAVAISENSIWPGYNIGANYNKYLWTKAEMFTRQIQVSTYVSPEEMASSTGVQVYGAPLDDYFWRSYYGINPFEEIVNGERMRYDDDTTLKNQKYFAEVMKNELMNFDEKLGNVLHYNNEFGFSSLFDTEWNLKSSSGKMTAMKKNTIEGNFQYTKKPYDYRTLVKENIDTYLYSVTAQTGTYEIYEGDSKYNGDGFALAVGESFNELVYESGATYRIINISRNIEGYTVEVGSSQKL